MDEGQKQIEEKLRSNMQHVIKTYFKQFLNKFDSKNYKIIENY